MIFYRGYSAGQQRSLAHSRRAAILSRMVTLRGLVSRRATRKSSLVTSRFAANAEVSPAMTACSISEPLNPQDAATNDERLKEFGSRLRFFRWMDQISLRALSPGR